jgi:hypothetical protein
MSYDIDNALTRPELDKRYHIVDSWDEYSCKGVFVDIIFKEELPNPNEILKYYGNYAPLIAFRPCIVDRFVILKDDGGYLIIPEHERWSYYLLEKPNVSM